MGTHSRFSPSATEREYTCPGSFLLNEQEPDHQSVDAAHGTAAHHIGEICLRTNRDVDTFGGCTLAVDANGNTRFVHEKAPLNEMSEMAFEVDDEMIVCVQEYVDRCRALPGDHFVEVRVEHTPWCPDYDEWGDPLDPQFGTSDHVACIGEGVDPVFFPESTLVVTDLKYGKGVMVFAKENKQAIKYALGVWREYNWIYNFKRVVIRISQPRLNHFDEWELSVEELLEWGQKIKKRLELVFAEDPPFVASEKGCKFCKVNGKCVTLQNVHTQLAGIHFDDLTAEVERPPRTLTNDELFHAYNAIPVLKVAMNALQDEVFRRMAEGQKIGRKKLVASYTHRAWTDEEGARAYLRSKGISDEALIAKTFVSPAQAEKHLPPHLWEELAEFYDRPPGQPVIVDEDDNRPPYRNPEAIMHFDTEDDGF